MDFISTIHFFFVVSSFMVILSKIISKKFDIIENILVSLMVAIKQLYSTELKNSKKYKIFHRLIQNHKEYGKKE